MAVEVVIRVKMLDEKQLPPGSHNMSTWARTVGREVAWYIQNGMSSNLFEGVDSIEVITSDTLSFSRVVS